MTKTVSLLAVLLLCSSFRASLAADCLTQVDGITVQFDLPASEAIAGTQTGTRKATDLDTKSEAAGLPHTPAGRPGAPTGAGGETMHPATGLPVNNQLSEAQRKEVQALLHEARAADSLGNEAKCMEFLQKAQNLVAKKS